MNQLIQIKNGDLQMKESECTDQLMDKSTGGGGSLNILVLTQGRIFCFNDRHSG